MVSQSQRDTFDRLLEAEIAALPEHIQHRLEEVPVIVDDEPSPHLLDELDMTSGETLCGLHSGIPLTERSPEMHGTLPTTIRLFRGPIFAVSGYSMRALKDQIHVTLLHEIGHHFGLDEDDLDRLGYG